jgi:cytochrome c-type biogenesis protein CcmH/NrfG
MIARVLLGAAAVGLAVVLVLSLGSVRANQRSRVVAFSPAGKATPARVEAALADARSARRLAPNSDPNLVEAFLLVRLRRGADAQHVLESIVRREPDNLDAWLLLGNVALDRRTVQDARRHAERLDPFLARSR